MVSQADPAFSKQQVEDMKEALTEELFETTIISAALSATGSSIIFVAPKKCTITSIKMGVTTSVAAHADNHWTIAVANQTGDAALLSSSFSSDSDVATTSNGSRAFTADVLLSLNNNGTNEFLQNADLAAGDILILTATKAASAANLVNCVAQVKFKAVD